MEIEAYHPGWRRNSRNVAAACGLLYVCEAFLISSLAIVCLVLLAACNSGSHPPRIGSAAPQFTITDSQRTVALSQFQGKPVVLNFWATWCPPCIQEMPSLVQLQKQLGDKVTILAVSEDDDDSAYKQFVRDHNVDLLTVRDTGQKTNGALRHLQVS